MRRAMWVAQIYKGYPMREIANNVSFEETAYLILNGSLPRRCEFEALSSSLSSKAKVKGKVSEVMKILGREAHPSTP